MTKSTTFSQTRIQLHVNMILKNANGACAFMGNFLCGVERVKSVLRSICIASFATWKRISEMLTFPPLQKFLRTPMIVSCRGLTNTHCGYVNIYCVCFPLDVIWQFLWISRSRNNQARYFCFGDFKYQKVSEICSITLWNWQFM